MPEDFPDRGQMTFIEVQAIDPSPFQRRQHFEEDKLKGLAASIQRDGLIEPIVVRPNGGVTSLLQEREGGGPSETIRILETIAVQVVKVNDLQARRMSAAENLQREDLSTIETIEAVVKIIDAELIEDKQYAAMGKKPPDRVKALLGTIDSVRRSRERGFNPAKEAKQTSHKFVGRVKKIFKNLPKPLEWRSFYNHDLPILMDISEEVQKVSIQNDLNRSQIRALEMLREVSSEEFQRVITHDQEPSNLVKGPDSVDSSQIGLGDLSAREIKDIAEKAAKKASLTELNRARVSPSSNQETVIYMMSRLGIPVERIAALLKINRKTAKKYSENPRLIRSIKKSLKKGHACHKVAEEHGCPEPLVWSVALEGKSDQERFKSLGWGLRTWDHWYFNNIDQRFGDEWPGQIPAQLVAHTLFYFTNQGDLVFDPMAGGGVVPDTSLAFNRKCWSFDLADRPETRPEIEPHQWNPENLLWPVKGSKKPDLIFFDPPYFKKQENNYSEDSISMLSRKDYLKFFKELFPLFREYTKAHARIAFLNADWRDFQGLAAMEEDPDQSILLLDYMDIMRRSGWKITHIIDCPLSTQRFLPNMVGRMQRNRTLGVVRRSLLIGRKK